MFQSTHPCGVRLRSRWIVLPFLRSFNPRTPAGCDLVVLGSHVTRRTRFNPRTPAGCDCQDSMIHSFTHPVSIHAPLRGATG